VVAPGESARLRRVPAFGPSPAVARVVSLRSTPRATAPLPSWNRVERRTGKMGSAGGPNKKMGKEKKKDEKEEDHDVRRCSLIPRPQLSTELG